MSDEQNKIIFSENLKKYMRLTNTNQKDLMTLFQLPSATISSWVNGKRLPRMDKIKLLADYFNVSITDLLEPSKSTDNIQSDLNELIGLWEELDDRGRQDVMLSLTKALREMRQRKSQKEDNAIKTGKLLAIESIESSDPDKDE